MGKNSTIKSAPWQLPIGWSWVSLKDIAPRDSTTVTPSDFPKKRFNYLGLGDVESGQWKDINPETILGKEKSSNCVSFNKTHVLYSKLRPYLNKVVVPEFLGVGSTEWIPLQPLDCLERKYLGWFLRSPWFVKRASLNSNTTGSRMPRLRMSTLWGTPVPIPPSIEIQKRIVHRTESLLEEVQEAREIVREMEWQTEKVMETALEEVFGKRSENSDWERKPIGELLNNISTGATPPSKVEKYYGGKIPWYTPGDLGKSKFLSTSERNISEIAVKQKKARIFPKGTLLIVGIGATIGKVGLPTSRCSANQQIMGLNFVEEVLQEFAYYWFLANLTLIKKTAKQATLPIINQKKIKSLSFTFPKNKSRQKKIVSYLDNVSQSSDLIIETLIRDSKRLVQLEQTILEKAFQGEL